MAGPLAAEADERRRGGNCSSEMTGIPAADADADADADAGEYTRKTGELATDLEAPSGRRNEEGAEEGLEFDEADTDAFNAAEHAKQRGSWPLSLVSTVGNGEGCGCCCCCCC